jgi:glutamine amidotransferase
MITIVDYDIGNIHSVHKAFQYIGADVVITGDSTEILRADGVVLPGVAAFGDAMANLRRLNIVEPLLRAIDGGLPFLGICVGMQVLFETSEELGTHVGLGVLPGTVQRFEGSVKVPQIGWNRIHPRAPHPLLANVPAGSYVYFAHSYRAVPSDLQMVMATTDYAGRYPSAVARGNVCGIQFHPEKSQRTGLRILSNFVAMVEGDST